MFSYRSLNYVASTAAQTAAQTTGRRYSHKRYGACISRCCGSMDLCPPPPARAPPPYTTVAENAGAGAPSARRVPQRSSSGKSDLESAVSEPGSDDPGHCGLHVQDLRQPATALESQLSHGRSGRQMLQRAHPIRSFPQRGSIVDVEAIGWQAAGRVQNGVRLLFDRTQFR